MGYPHGRLLVTGGFKMADGGKQTGSLGGSLSFVSPCSLVPLLVCRDNHKIIQEHRQSSSKAFPAPNVSLCAPCLSDTHIRGRLTQRPLSDSGAQVYIDLLYFWQLRCRHRQRLRSLPNRHPSMLLSMGMCSFIRARSMRVHSTLFIVRHKAKTPMIAGIISGGAVGLAWIIGFIIYFIKRHRREKRAIAAGYKGHREMLDPPKKPQAFIIPPDPAIVEGALEPGDRAVDYPDANPSYSAVQALTVPPREDSEKSSPTNTPIATSPDLSHNNTTPTASPPQHMKYPPIRSTTAVSGHHSSRGYSGLS